MNTAFRSVLRTAFLCATAPTLALAQSPAKLSRTEVVVLADLSNRIAPTLHPAQIQRDTAILRIIAQEFGNVVRRNRYLFSHDRLRVLYLGGEGAPTEPRVDVGKMNVEHHVVVRELPQVLEDFHSQAVRPYLVVRRRYDGADFWSWFRYSAPQELRPDDPNRITQTRLIILTDGYLEFAPKIRREPGTYMEMAKLRGRSDWEKSYPKYKLNAVGYTLPNTKVLLLEVAPLHPEVNTSEEAILERYWSDWFRTMGITETTMVTNDQALPSIRDAVRQFLAP